MIKASQSQELVDGSVRLILILEIDLHNFATAKKKQLILKFKSISIKMLYLSLPRILNQLNPWNMFFFNDVADFSRRWWKHERKKASEIVNSKRNSSNVCENSKGNRRPHTNILPEIGSLLKCFSPNTGFIPSENSYRILLNCSISIDNHKERVHWQLLGKSAYRFY